MQAGNHMHMTLYVTKNLHEKLLLLLTDYVAVK